MFLFTLKKTLCSFVEHFREPHVLQLLIGTFQSAQIQTCSLILLRKTDGSLGNCTYKLVGFFLNLRWWAQRCHYLKIYGKCDFRWLSLLISFIWAQSERSWSSWSEKPTKKPFIKIVLQFCIFWIYEFEIQGLPPTTKINSKPIGQCYQLFSKFHFCPCKFAEDSNWSRDHFRSEFFAYMFFLDFQKNSIEVLGWQINIVLEVGNI